MIFLLFPLYVKTRTNKKRMPMTQNEIVLDEILSSGQYVKYIEVADAFLTDKADMMEQDRIINALKQIVRRNLKNALDYKNGKNARDGFKYKNDYKHYLKFLDEKEKLKSKTGNEKRSYATMGLGLLLDDSSTEVNRIEFECVRNLANSSMVKDIANKILNGHVLSLTYRTNKGEEQKVVFHPQYLKEYNNRWAVYGKCEENENYPTCIKIDSIVKYYKLDDKEYCEPVNDFYRNYFKDFIGFTRKRNGKVQDIYIRTNDKLVHDLIKTKPFHESQEELEQWSDESQQGKFVLHIIPNIELRTKLLSYGSGITMLGNGWFQREFKEEIKKMAELYNNKE